MAVERNFRILQRIWMCTLLSEDTVVRTGEKNKMRLYGYGFLFIYLFCGTEDSAQVFALCRWATSTALFIF